MINIGKRILVAIWCVALFVTCMPVQQLYAEEMTVEKNVEQSEDVALGQESEKLNYVYVESPYLDCNSEQNVMISWGDGTENVEEIILLCEKADGTILEWNYSKNEGELYLFSRTFQVEENGVYQMKILKYMVNGNWFEIDLTEIGVAAQFQVGEEASVVTIDESNVNVAEQDIAATLAETEGISLEKDDNNNTVIVQEAKRTFSGATTTVEEIPDDVVIVLDPGHGGKDPGASNSTYGGNEKTICLKIAQYMKQELEAHEGIKIVLTRETNLSVTEEYTIKERVDFAAANNADLFVSIHLNASSSGSAYGAEVYYPNQNYDASVGIEGEKLAEKIQKELVKLGLYNRGIKIRNTVEDKYSDGSLQDYYGVIRYSKLAGFPGLIIEHAFIDNDAEYQQYLSTDEKLKALAVADATGILNYLDLDGGEWLKDSVGWWYRYKDGTYPKDGWNTVEGQMYYFDEKGYMVTGWLELDNDTYYLDESGSYARGWKMIDDVWYYFDSIGIMQTGWLLDGATWYYLEEDGKMVTGWKDVNGARYYFTLSGAMVTGTQVIDGKTYSFEPNGALIVKNGWELDGNIWYYYEYGELVTGWKTIKGYKYYFASDGKMVTGWQKIEEVWYHFVSSGKMETGWLLDGAIWYYLEADGKMVTGWKDINGARYYFVSSGAMVTGTQVIDGKTYSFASSGALIAKTGWELDGNIWYYYEYGEVATGWKTIKGCKYYFTSDGKMVTGWQKIEGTWYYFAGSGAMQTGWLLDRATWYYLEADGKMVTGWQDINGARYYFVSSGAMVTGWQKIEGIWYCFVGSGKMQTGWLLDGMTWYYLEADGKMATGWRDIKGVSYYFVSSGAMVTGTYEIDGVIYTFNEDGGLVGLNERRTGWIETDAGWQYYEDGMLVHSDVTAIMGESQATVAQMVSYYKTVGKSYPEELKAGGAETIEAFCQIVLEEASAENVKAEVLYAQIMKETGWLQFAGDVKITQYNFGGLGATGNGVTGEVFEDVREGIRAQTQHLKAYASKDDLVNECVDNRFKYVSRGCAQYVEWLGIQENPNNTDSKKYGWAASKYYGFQLCEMITTLLNK